MQLVKINKKLYATEYSRSEFALRLSVCTILIVMFFVTVALYSRK